MAVTYYFQSRHDGNRVRQVEMDAGLMLAFTRHFNGRGETLARCYGIMGTPEAV